ncbi:Hypothetical_protein [Hexamita inflata]|uniref:Hypothetical_protein n=1 Tax=Hexamita inflata TaxID=28002 RepID=A0AA86N3T6_9EUKA|nr:Hypothetical protein HINF_LOCUS39 [Hexamita inflata]
MNLEQQKELQLMVRQQHSRLQFLKEQNEQNILNSKLKDTFIENLQQKVDEYKQKLSDQTLQLEQQQHIVQKYNIIEPNTLILNEKFHNLQAMCKQMQLQHDDKLLSQFDVISQLQAQIKELETYSSQQQQYYEKQIQNAQKQPQNRQIIEIEQKYNKLNVNSQKLLLLNNELTQNLQQKDLELNKHRKLLQQFATQAEQMQNWQVIYQQVNTNLFNQVKQLELITSQQEEQIFNIQNELKEQIEQSHSKSQAMKFMKNALQQLNMNKNSYQNVIDELKDVIINQRTQQSKFNTIIAQQNSIYSQQNEKLEKTTENAIYQNLVKQQQILDMHQKQLQVEAQQFIQNKQLTKDKLAADQRVLQIQQLQDEQNTEISAYINNLLSINNQLNVQSENQQQLINEMQTKLNELLKFKNDIINLPKTENFTLTNENAETDKIKIQNELYLKNESNTRFEEQTKTIFQLQDKISNLKSQILQQKREVLTTNKRKSKHFEEEEDEFEIEFNIKNSNQKEDAVQDIVQTKPDNNSLELSNQQQMKSLQIEESSPLRESAMTQISSLINGPVDANKVFDLSSSESPTKIAQHAEQQVQSQQIAVLDNKIENAIVQPVQTEINKDQQQKLDQQANDPSSKHEQSTSKEHSDSLGPEVELQKPIPPQPKVLKIIQKSALPMIPESVSQQPMQPVSKPKLSIKPLIKAPIQPITHQPQPQQENDSNQVNQQPLQQQSVQSQLIPETQLLSQPQPQIEQQRQNLDSTQSQPQQQVQPPERPNLDQTPPQPSVDLLSGDAFQNMTQLDPNASILNENERQIVHAESLMSMYEVSFVEREPKVNQIENSFKIKPENSFKQSVKNDSVNKTGMEQIMHVESFVSMYKMDNEGNVKEDERKKAEEEMFM